MEKQGKIRFLPYHENDTPINRCIILREEGKNILKIPIITDMTGKPSHVLVTNNLIPIRIIQAIKDGVLDEDDVVLIKVKNNRNLILDNNEAVISIPEVDMKEFYKSQNNLLDLTDTLSIIESFDTFLKQKGFYKSNVTNNERNETIAEFLSKIIVANKNKN